VSGFERYWTRRRQQTAQLVADDDISDREIALRVGRSLKWVEEQKHNPLFRDRVAQIRQETRQSLLETGIAVKAFRLRAMDERWRLLQQIRRERAATGGECPGMSTGIVMRVIKTIGAGDSATTVEQLVVDKALLEAELALEQAAAKEMNSLEPPNGPARGASLELNNGDGRRVVFTLDLGTGVEIGDDEMT
jgi:hypothetical protein